MVWRRTSDCQIYIHVISLFILSSCNVRTTCPPSAVARLSTTDECVYCAHTQPPPENIHSQ
jgi:hypothetical protein